MTSGDVPSHPVYLLAYDKLVFIKDLEDGLTVYYRCLTTDLVIRSQVGLQHVVTAGVTPRAVSALIRVRPH